MRMECWLIGTFRLIFNIVREPSMPMRIECPGSAGSVDSARGRIVRFPRQIRWWPI